MRVIEGLGELARIFEETVVVHERAIELLAGASSVVLHKKAHDLFGSAKLRDLEQSTQDERVAKGYSANEPLLRTGELLRDTLERAHVHDMAGIGSPEKVMAYHEYGFYNHRAGKFIAPRPVLKIAMTESAPDIEGLIQEALGVTFGDATVNLKP